jgi:8-oxo-dGTP pyrophosphatase MutT (NUDIX family)
MPLDQQFIRPIAICLFWHNGRILVAEHLDPLKQQTFYRPLGGGIEYGEHSRDTIVREIREELGVAVTDLHYLHTIENIFVYNGERGHEIVQVYNGRFPDESLYHQPQLQAHEDNGTPFRAIWKPLTDFQGDNAPPLYPDGLPELIATLLQS